jgi:CheY-like chemotaxis protein
MPGNGTAPLLEGRRVLVIEDEYYLADDIARLLRKIGAEVIGPVGEVDDALQLVRDGDAVDIALLDINLRGEMIFPVADELRRRQIPFIFTSGYERSPLPPDYDDVPLLEKPLDDRAVQMALRRLVQQRHAPVTEE